MDDFEQGGEDAESQAALSTSPIAGEQTALPLGEGQVDHIKGWREGRHFGRHQSRLDARKGR